MQSLSSVDIFCSGIGLSAGNIGPTVIGYQCGLCALLTCLLTFGATICAVPVSSATSHITSTAIPNCFSVDRLHSIVHTIVDSLYIGLPPVF